MAQTLDSLADLKIWQHEDGFRFGLDAVLLATDLPVTSGKAADLGAGQGASALILSRGFEGEIWAVERQVGLFDLLIKNLESNPTEFPIHALRADIRDLKKSHKELAQTFDFIITNPPYFRSGSGQQSPNPERREAHEELHGGLGDFLEIGRWLLKPRGFLKCVLPPNRLVDVWEMCSGCDLSVYSMRSVHAHRGEDAYLVESVLRRDHRGGPVIKSPLIVHEGDVFAPEVQRRLELT